MIELRPLFLVCCVLFCVLNVSGQSLVYDSTTEPPDWVGLYPADFVAVGDGSVVFTAVTQRDSRELWKTDGTPEGTGVLSDIYPGAYSSDPHELTSVNGIVLFSANDGSDYEGRGLWRTDGTRAGTVLVKNIAFDCRPAWLVAMGNAVYFTATADGGRELWRSDGTEAGTYRVADIFTGTNSSNPRLLTKVGDSIYFVATTAKGHELWKTDGTTAGTVMVSDICPGTCSSSPDSLTNVDGTLYFTADLGDGRHLWKSDAAGTAAIANAGENPQELRAGGTKLFYRASDAVYGSELWVFDGAAPFRLTDLSPGNSFPGGFAFCNGFLYFSAESGTSGRELFKSDGTPGGTVMVREIAAGTNGSSPEGMYAWGDYVYFEAEDDNREWAYWRTDGTSAGTTRFVRIDDQLNSQMPFTAIGPYLYFSGQTHEGSALYRTDGTVAGTIRLHASNPVPISGEPFRMGEVADGRFVFAAFTSRLKDRRSLFVTNGRPDGTTAIDSARLPPWSSWSAVSGGRIFYNADEPWITDGTTAHLLKDINPTGASDPQWFSDVNGTVFFVAFDGAMTGLYKSGGTEETTVLLRQLCSNCNGALRLAKANGVLYFIVTEGVGNLLQLWKSDGTVGGTQSLAAFTSLNFGAEFNGSFYFGADSKLWRTDGTAAGTTVFADLQANDIAPVGGTLFINAYKADGYELWKSDGSTVTLVKKFIPPARVRVRPQFAAVNGLLLFAASDGVHGIELWRSDGTENGTFMVKDINPGRFGSLAEYNQVVANGYLWFAATDGATGWEPWRSDGTEAGTTLVADLEPGAVGSQPAFDKTSGRLYFIATVIPYGTELWTLCPTDTASLSLTAPSSVIAGQDVPIMAIARDAFNGAVSCNYTVVHFSSSDPAARLPVDSELGTDGLFITLRTIGTQTLTVTDPSHPGLTATVTIRVTAGAASASTSTVSASPTRILIAGRTSAITVRLRDQAGNTLTASGGNVTLSTTAGTLGAVTDHADGTYTAVLTSLGSPASAKVTGALNGNALSASTTVKFFGTRGDVGGDANGDVLWRHTNGSNFLWQMNGSDITPTSLPPVPDANWKMTAFNDFNGDGKSDVFWRHTNGTNFLWLMNGGTITPLPVTNIAAGTYDVAGSGDVNGDGRADIFWRNANDGGNLLWLMNGATPTQMWVPPVPAPWTVVGLGDTDGDGRAEVVWRHPNGLVYLWTFDQTGSWTGGGALAQVADTEWRIVAIADVTGDGIADFIWRRTTGEVFLWEMHGFAFNPISVAMVSDTNWKIAVVMDVNGDGKADVVWRHTTGPTFLWLMNGAQFTPLSLPPVWDTEWTMAGPH